MRTLGLVVIFVAAVLIHDARAQTPVEDCVTDEIDAEATPAVAAAIRKDCERKLAPKPAPARWRQPPPRIWQCNDIRVTETVLQPGIVHYDLAGTIWGGSQFTLNITNGDMFFNGRQCLMLRG